jgi:hypothetical protein
MKKFNKIYKNKLQTYFYLKNVKAKKNTLLKLAKAHQKRKKKVD